MQRRRGLVALVALATALASACAPAREPLLIGVNPWPGYAFFFLAEDEGFFEDEGVSVRLIEFTSLEDARRAYERGHLDALGTTLVDVLQAREHPGRSLQVVQVADFSSGGDQIVLRAGLGSLADLRGRRVGVEAASLGAYILARAAEHAGLGLDAFEWVGLDQVNMASALQRGDVDAVVTYPPFSAAIARLPGATIVFDSRKIAGEVVDVIAVDSVVAVERAAEVRGMLRAFNRAQEAYFADPKPHAAVMARREGMRVEDFSRALAEDITIVRANAQAAYIGPEGRLQGIVNHLDQVLRAIGVMRGPDRRSAVLSDRFLPDSTGTH